MPTHSRTPELHTLTFSSDAFASDPMVFDERPNNHQSRHLRVGDDFRTSWRQPRQRRRRPLLNVPPSQGLFATTRSKRGLLGFGPNEPFEGVGRQLAAQKREDMLCKWESFLDGGEICGVKKNFGNRHRQRVDKMQQRIARMAEKPANYQAFTYAAPAKQEMVAEEKPEDIIPGARRPVHVQSTVFHSVINLLLCVQRCSARRTHALSTARMADVVSAFSRL